MKKRLTDRLVRGLKARAARYDVWDAGFEGQFGVRVAPSGKKTWSVVVRDADGRKRRVGLGDYDENNGLAKARKAARAATARVEAGECPAESGPTFAELCETFLARYPGGAGLRASTVDCYRRIIRARLLPAWGRRAAGAVTRADVNRLHDGIARDDGAPVQANRTITLAGLIFNFAADAGYFGVETNPCWRKRRFRETPRDRTLSDAELRAFWAALEARPTASRCFFRLMALTGARVGELAGARWSEFDAEARVWTIPAERVKSGRAHRVPLSSAARRVADELRDETDGGEYLFAREAGRPPVYPQRELEDLRATLGFDFRTHDIRRTVGTGLARLGVPDAGIGRVLNHRWAFRNVTSQIYVVDDRLEDKRAALELWGAHVERLVEAEPAAKAGAR